MASARGAGRLSARICNCWPRHASSTAVAGDFIHDRVADAVAFVDAGAVDDREPPRRRRIPQVMLIFSGGSSRRSAVLRRTVSGPLPHPRPARGCRRRTGGHGRDARDRCGYGRARRPDRRRRPRDDAGIGQIGSPPRASACWPVSMRAAWQRRRPRPRPGKSAAPVRGGDGVPTTVAGSIGVGARVCPTSPPSRRRGLPHPDHARRPRHPHRTLPPADRVTRTRFVRVVDDQAPRASQASVTARQAPREPRPRQAGGPLGRHAAARSACRSDLAAAALGFGFAQCFGGSATWRYSRSRSRCGPGSSDDSAMSVSGPIHAVGGEARARW